MSVVLKKKMRNQKKRPEKIENRKVELLGGGILHPPRHWLCAAEYSLPAKMKSFLVKNSVTTGAAGLAIKPKLFVPLDSFTSVHAP